MLYNIWFEVSALIILIVLLVLFYIKFNAPFKKYRIFLYLLWSLLLSTVTSLFTCLLPSGTPIWIIHTCNSLYFVFHGLLLLLLLIYVYSLTDYMLRNVKEYIPCLVPSFFGIFLAVTSWFSNGLFWLDDGGGYHRGKFIYVFYLVAIFNFLFIVDVLVKRKHSIIRRERVSIFVFLGMIGIAILIQFFFPKILVENFVCAICLMISQLVVQNPETIMDGTTGMLSKQGFSTLITPLFDQKAEFGIGFLHIDNYTELEKNYSYERLERRVSILAEYLKSHTDFIYIRIDSATFCFIEKNMNSKNSWNMLFHNLDAAHIFNYLKQQGIGVRFKIKTGMFHCPKDVDSFESLTELLHAMERWAMDKDKEVQRFDLSDISVLRRKKQLNVLVREAVWQNMLKVVYQPIYNVSKGCFTGAEALLRMHTKKFGDVSPQEFIQIAEETGSIHKYTQFVLEVVSAFVHNSKLAELGIERINVNLSMLDCDRAELSKTIVNALSKNGVSPNMLAVEVTETAFATMTEQVYANLVELSDQGIAVMLDDYGTGYSNLGRLSKLPIDVVKLDKSLIDNIITSTDARIILENSINMIHGIHKQVLAEGVETKEQADYLISLGCEYLQGYYYAKPVSKEQLEVLLYKQNTNKFNV